MDNFSKKMIVPVHAPKAPKVSAYSTSQPNISHRIVACQIKADDKTVVIYNGIQSRILDEILNRVMPSDQN